jgi:hypothetical protein
MGKGKIAGRFIYRLLTVISMILISSSTAYAQAGIFVHSVQVEPQKIDIAKNDSARISWYLVGKSVMHVFICDLDGRIVRNLYTGSEGAPGGHAIDWDGRDNQGNQCPDGLYVPIIKIQAASRAYGIYNPTMQAWGYKVEGKDISYNPRQKQIIFTLDKPALCLMRIGETNGGPYYLTLFGWEMREAGTYSESWDGMDPNDIVQVAKRENFAIFLDAFTLPQNTILLTGSINDEYRDESNFKRFTLLPPRGGRISVHALRPGIFNNDLPFTVKIERSKRVERGVSVITGSIKLSMHIAGNLDKSRMLQDKLEVYLFMDGRFLYEIPIQKLPATAKLDTTKFPNGEHIMTVNLRTVSDRCGAYTMKVMVEN